MSELILAARSKEYSANFEEALGQRMARIEKFVTVDTTFKGVSKRYNQIAARELESNTGRLQATNLREAGYDFYWLFTQAWDDAVPFDQWDDALLGQVSLPTSEVMAEQVAAWARKVDSVIAAAAVGTRTVGSEDAQTTESLSSDQKVAVNFVASGSPANSGLTYAKVLRALEIFNTNEVDIAAEGGLVAFIRAKQVTDLYTSIAQFNQNGVYTQAIQNIDKDKLLQGQETFWNGILWVPSQRIVHSSSTDIASVPLFTKKGVKFVKDMKPTKMSDRPDLKHALQIYSSGRLGAVRVRDEAVVEIACDESP
jgi:hypothetical protein